MFVDKNICEREILKIVAQTNDITELRTKLEQYWDNVLRTSYNDNIHTLTWFKEKVAQNVRDANNGGTNWESAVNAICEKQSDINNLLKQIERGGLFGFGVNDNREMFIDQLMKSGDVVATSLVLCVSAGDIISTDARGSQYLLENSMQAAFQSRPEMLKMMLGFYPNTFIKPELLDLYKTQAPAVLIKTYLQQNLITYNKFLKSRGLNPVFAKEDIFEKQVNESIANIEIVQKIKERTGSSKIAAALNM